MDGLVKLLFLVFVVMYVVSPIDAAPGPVDDFMVIMLGLLACKGFVSSNE